MVQQRMHNTGLLYGTCAILINSKCSVGGHVFAHSVFFLHFRFLSSGIRDHVGGPVSGCGDKRPGNESFAFGKHVFLSERIVACW